MLRASGPEHKTPMLIWSIMSHSKHRISPRLLIECKGVPGGGMKGMNNNPLQVT